METPPTDNGWRDRCSSGPPARIGIASAFLEAVEPITEADPNAVLIQFLAAAGNLLGNGPHLVVGERRHALRLWPLVVGSTSSEKQGTAAGLVFSVLDDVDPAWTACRKMGIASGEAVVHHVRDDTERVRRKRHSGGPVVETTVTLEGVADKRLLLIEEEFSRVLRLARKDGTTLSATLREAWDHDVLMTTSKTAAERATGAHVTVIGHITPEEQRANDPTRARLVLLGASNLFLAFPGVLRHALGRLAGSEVSIYAAHGPGRSYGIEAGVPGLKFTGIAQSGLVDAIEREHEARGAAATAALLTDVGNDILYRSGVDRVLGWIEEIAGRLQALGASVAVTSLPQESLEALPAWKFCLIRPLFFPFRPMPREEVLRQVREVQERLEDLGRRRGVAILPTRPEWYGFDHFHLRRGARRTAFDGWLDAVLPRKEDAARGGGLSVGGARLRLHRPAECVVAGIRRRRNPQGWPIAPGARLYSF